MESMDESWNKINIELQRSFQPMRPKRANPHHRDQPIYFFEEDRKSKKQGGVPGGGENIGDKGKIERKHSVGPLEL